MLSVCSGHYQAWSILETETKLSKFLLKSDHSGSDVVTRGNFKNQESKACFVSIAS